MNRRIAPRAVSGTLARVACISTSLVAAFAATASALPQSTARDTALAVHLLNRLAFGPRAGDVERVLNIGTDKWIEHQLQPDTALDVAAANALEGCPMWTEPTYDAVGRLSGGAARARRSG